MAQPYVGEIRMFGGNFTINGWIPCDGRLLSIAVYDTLFFLLGDTYGGDGVSTFAVPDLRGRAPIHMGTGPGGSPYTIGQQGGTETVTLTVQNLPAHSHPVTVSTETGSSNAPSGSGYLAATTSTELYSGTATSTVFLKANAVTPAGSGQPLGISMPYLPINFLISAFGIFPPRS